MGWLEALLLGIIQGLTEFLPVSSSGHLEMAKFILGDTSIPEESMLMTVVLHAATALSTLLVFRKDVVEIFRGLMQFKWNDQMKFSVRIVLSMIPAALVGVLLNDEIESLFGGQLLLVGSMLLVTATLLLLADRAKTTQKNVTYWDAIIIGVAQAIAIMPGISRSGATISTSVLLKIDRSKAARFSFLMVVPLILGAMARDLLSGAVSFETSQIIPLLVGFVAAFFTGIIAITWMIALVQRAKLTWFAVYCFVVGISAITYSLFIA
jgi:undecaprenyl-diphosphatase